jgi:hypothetical protein
MSARSVKFGAAVVFAATLAGVGCGDEGEEARAACGDIVDGFARRWDECNRRTYEEAHQIFSDAFACDDINSLDSGKVDQCLGAIEQLDCGALQSNPPICTEAVTQ